MPPVTARYRWTLDTLQTGKHYAGKLRRGALAARVIIVGAFALLAMKFLLGGEDGFSTLNAVLVVGISLGVGLVIGLALKNHLAQKQFSQRPDANSEIEWTASESGISISTSTASSEIQWSAFQIIISTPKGFLFMPNRQVFNFIPSHAFESKEAVEAVKNLARQHAKDFREM